jgi:hypothetical protein
MLYKIDKNLRGDEGGKVHPLSTTTHSFVYQILELEPVENEQILAHA